jgi:glycosyltransferase involved in cell wall biosynthesis
VTDPFFVSVIMPAYNAASFIPDAAESIRRQAYPRLELIIVDDGSTDRTAEVAKSLTDLNVHYVYQPNGGPARARNHGLRLARGDVIALLDADDLWPPDRLRCQLRYLESDPLTEIVLGRFQCFRTVPHLGGGSDIQTTSPAVVNLLVGAALYRRKVFDRIGGFDEAMRYCEDADWFMRAREQDVPIVVHHEVTLLYRRHQANMTRGRDARGLRVVDVLKKSLDRRRKQHGEAHSMPRAFDVVDGMRRARDP